MLREIFSFFKRALDSKDIRKKLIITALVIAVYRFASHIPASGIDRDSLYSLVSGSAILTLLDVFSGGTLANFSVMSLGIQPYISASIILQMLTFVIPSLEEISKEGEYGQERINQYTRLLAIPIAALQAFAVYSLLHNKNILPMLSPLSLTALIITMICGSVFAIWLGELITEYGLGNGISFIVFIGIVGRIPVSIWQTLSTTTDPQMYPKIAIFVAIILLIIGAVVFMNEAIRKIPITYAKKNFATGSTASYLPLRLNQAGVIPIIFAVSLALVPSFIGQFLSTVNQGQFSQAASFIVKYLDPQSISYNIFYFLLVVGFTYFYTAVVFNPEKIAENLQKSGGFIPGIRPGKNTISYLNQVLTKITLAGGVFLGMIAILPSFFQNIVGVSNLAVGGTSILIAVSVVMDLNRDLEAKLVMKKYDRFV